MKNKKTIFRPIKLIGALVFLMAFTLNIQTSLNGEWELVNVGYGQSTCTGEGCSGGSEGEGSGGEDDKCKYRKLGQKSDGTYCCIESCNYLDSCSAGADC